MKRSSSCLRLVISLAAGSPCVALPAAAALPASMTLSADGLQLLQGATQPPAFYDTGTLRRLELRFEQADWWAQLAANYQSETNLAADLVFEGQVYAGVGVRFKGTTSYRTTGDSPKKPFNIEIDYTDPDLRLLGLRTLNLNNAASDASFVREALASNTYRRYLPSPAVGFVVLTINGQSWGVYVGAEQINGDMIRDWFPEARGDRFKVGSTGGGGAPGTGGLQPTDGTPPDSLGFPDGGFVPPDSTQGPGGGRPGGGGPGAGGGAGPGSTQTPGGGPPDSLGFPDGGFLPPDSTRGPGGGVPPDSTQGGAFPPPGGRGGVGGAGGFGGGGFGAGTAALTWLGADTTVYQGAYELSDRGTDDAWRALVRLCDVLVHTSDAALADSLDAVLDIDRALWYLAAENLFADSDGYLEKGGDYRIYHESETGRFHLLQYDANEVMATRGATLDPFEGAENANRPLIQRLLSVPEARARYTAHYRTLLAQAWTSARMDSLAAVYRDLIASEVALDTIKLESTAAFEADFDRLRDFVAQRRQYLLGLEEMTRPAPVVEAVVLQPREDGTVQATARLGADVAVAAVRLHVSGGLTGRFTAQSMLDDGAHGDGAAGDGLYGVVLAGPAAGGAVRCYVEAVAADEAGTRTFAPPGAEHDVYYVEAAPRRTAALPVALNELMAANDSTIADPQGDADDWVELINRGDAEVDLGGYFLSDDAEDLEKWAFPEATRLAGGAYLLVWADEDGGDEGLHASFKLSAGGEAVYLSYRGDSGLAILDSVVFGEQATDVAFGRAPDGDGPWQALPRPTPGEANAVATAVDGQADTPAVFALGPLYPNPFNRTATVPFALDVGGLAELTVINNTGGRVAVLVRGVLAAGPHQVVWDGRDTAGRAVATGVYFVQLQASEHTAVRKLLLLR